MLGYVNVNFTRFLGHCTESDPIFLGTRRWGPQSAYNHHAPLSGNPQKQERAAEKSAARSSETWLEMLWRLSYEDTARVWLDLRVLE